MRLAARCLRSVRPRVGCRSRGERLPWCRASAHAPWRVRPIQLFRHGNTDLSAGPNGAARTSVRDLVLTDRKARPSLPCSASARMISSLLHQTVQRSAVGTDTGRKRHMDLRSGRVDGGPAHSPSEDKIRFPSGPQMGDGWRFNRIVEDDIGDLLAGRRRQRPGGTADKPGQGTAHIPESWCRETTGFCSVLSGLTLISAGHSRLGTIRATIRRNTVRRTHFPAGQSFRPMDAGSLTRCRGPVRRRESYSSSRVPSPALAIRSRRCEFWSQCRCGRWTAKDHCYCSCQGSNALVDRTVDRLHLQ